MLTYYDCPKMGENGLNGTDFNKKMQQTAHKIKHGRVIIKGDIYWSSLSPDVTPPDFRLWGYLKSKVYTNKPQAIEELKKNISFEIVNITPDMQLKFHGRVIRRLYLLVTLIS